MKALISAYMEKGLYAAALFLAFLATLSMIAILLVVIGSVVFRIFAMPLFFSEELVGLLMSVALFLALPMVSWKGEHIRVSLLRDFIQMRQERLGPWPGRLLFLLAMCCGLAFTSWIFYEALPWLEFAIKRNLKTETARILLYPAMVVVPISFGLCFLIYAARLLGLISRQGEV